MKKKHCNGDKEIVKAPKNDCYFNKHGCILYRNKSRLSVSQIFVTVTKSFFCVFCSHKEGLLVKKQVTRENKIRCVGKATLPGGKSLRGLNAGRKGGHARLDSHEMGYVM